MGVLVGKTALVTGAAKGIGRATAERFRAEGAEVVGLVRPGSTALPAGMSVVHADARDPAAISAAVFDAAVSKHLDICVANAGTFGEYDAFVDADPATWREVLEVNVLAVLATFQAAARRMIGGGCGGRLLVTSSLAGLRAEPRSPAYGASKAGVHAAVQSLAVELAPFAITVNAVAPGQIDTEMNARNMELLGKRRGQTLAEVRRRWLARIPAGRLGAADEVATVFAFLASDDAAFITGETIRVDGGELLSQGPVGGPSAVVAKPIWTR